MRRILDERRDERLRTGETLKQQNDRRRSLVLSLKAEGKTFADIGRTVGVTHNRIREIVKRDELHRKSQNREAEA
jgi:DNA-directed RNA polymerase sigma subunit (sigma70/sigma32)